MDLKKYLIVTGVLGISYIGYTYLSNRKPKLTSGGKTITLELTRKILQEIKHQMLIVCLSFAEGIAKNKAQKMTKEQELQLDTYFRTEMVKIYEQKQDLIIGKYQLSKLDYGESLKKYSSDKEVSRNEKEILQMMETAITGQSPDLSVPKESQNKFDRSRLKAIYKDMCLLIGTKVWSKLHESQRLDPTFNPKDDSHFKKAIREISIYDLKIKFLNQQGFSSAWGCPNEIFFKLIEQEKQKNPAYKSQVMLIQKAYQQIIEKVSQDPQSVTEKNIVQMMNELESPTTYNKGLFGSSEIKPVLPQRMPAISSVVSGPNTSSINSSRGVNQSLPARKQEIKQPVKEEQQVDLQALMMQELMSRTSSNVPKNQASDRKNVKEQEVDLEALMMQELMNRTSQKVEIKQIQPVKVIESRPVEVIESRPVEVIESRPVEVIESKQVEVIEQKPAQVIEQKPAQVIEQKIVEMIESKPVEAIQSRPESIEQIKKQEQVFQQIQVMYQKPAELKVEEQIINKAVEIVEVEKNVEVIEENKPQIQNDELFVSAIQDEPLPQEKAQVLAPETSQIQANEQNEAQKSNEQNEAQKSNEQNEAQKSNEQNEGQKKSEEKLQECGVEAKVNEEVNNE